MLLQRRATLFMSLILIQRRLFLSIRLVERDIPVFFRLTGRHSGPHAGDVIRLWLLILI
jgi:hypothetical protein